MNACAVAIVKKQDADEAKLKELTHARKKEKEHSTVQKGNMVE